MVKPLDRQSLLDDKELVGTAYCRAYSQRVDEWLTELFEEVADGQEGVALAAVGGYGRSELSVHSDIDVMLLRDKDTDAEELAAKLWYPIWDEGLKLGHSVRTEKEALELADEDLDTATALLSLRCLGGDKKMVRALRNKAVAQWVRRRKKWLQTMDERIAARYQKFDELAFLLEPDLKSSKGGLRDAHILKWLAFIDPEIEPDADGSVTEAYEVLMSARVELQRSTNRATNTLLLQEQDAVADSLGYEDADALMREIAAAGRVIAWSSEDAWRSFSTGQHAWYKPQRRKNLGRGIFSRAGAVYLTDDVDFTDPMLVLRCALAAAKRDLALPTPTLELLAENAAALPEPWPQEARQAFEKILLCGQEAVLVLESLDQFGLFVGLMPEWEPCRSKPQRNAYHRFTVDRHLLEAAARASELADRVDDPGLLVVGALFHDIGKGYPGDHTDVGVEMIPVMAKRMGYNDIETGLLVDMCRHHLLLPDVATRRDTNDQETIDHVAETVGDVRLLKLLDALTEADSVATGPAAWSRWKAGLVRDLVARSKMLLETGESFEMVAAFPTAEQVELMERRERCVVVKRRRITVVMPDTYASLWKVAAVLAIHGLDVLQADVHSEAGMALQTFRVKPRFDDIDSETLTDQIWQAVDGTLDVWAALEQRIVTYESGRGPGDPQPVVPNLVSFDNESSSTATVVEIGAPDSLGLLSRLAHALSDQNLDISRAKVQTLGDKALDSFYVQDLESNKVTDPDHLAAIKKDVIEAIEYQEQLT